MTLPHRLYLDQAATSWPKLPAAVDAAHEFVKSCGATSGRGAYASARLAERWVADARMWLARLIGADNGHSIALCTSGTHALNAALVGLLRPGQRVVTTVIEHNSVLRPLHQLQTTLGLQVTTVPCDARGFVNPDDLARFAQAPFDALIVGHASNVTGAVQDLRAFGQIALRSGALFLVDASQSLGYLPIDVQACHIDCLAAACHKGLRALPGTGMLYVREEFHSTFRPIMFGGTGTSSERIDIVPEWPMSVEVGNLNLPGVVSQAVAARDLCENVGQDWATQWQAPFAKLVEGLRQFATLRSYGPALAEPHLPVVSFTVGDWDIHDFAAALDSSFNIEARSGLHCAALIHESLGSLPFGGTVRFSAGHSLATGQVDYVLNSLQQML